MYRRWGKRLLDLCLAFFFVVSSIPYYAHFRYSGGSEIRAAGSLPSAAPWTSRQALHLVQVPHDDRCLRRRREFSFRRGMLKHWSQRFNHWVRTLRVAAGWGDRRTSMWSNTSIVIGRLHSF